MSVRTVITGISAKAGFDKITKIRKVVDLGSGLCD